MNMPSQRELFHHRCQEIIRRGQRQVVSLSNVTWKEECAKLADDRGERITLSFLEGSLAFKREAGSLGSVLKPWKDQIIQLSVSPGKRPHAQWLPSGPPSHQRALAVSLAADLSVAWLCPAEPSTEGHWTPPAPRDKERTLCNLRRPSRQREKMVITASKRISLSPTGNHPVQREAMHSPQKASHGLATLQIISVWSRRCRRQCILDSEEKSQSTPLGSHEALSRFLGLKLQDRWSLATNDIDGDAT